MKKLFFLISLLFATKLFAQTDSNSVVVNKDARIDLLIKKQIQINDETTRDSRRNIPGFRIQVINSSNRGKVFAAKTKIYQQYPELKVYLLYQPPNYRLKVGNFKTSDEADVYVKKMAALFPTGMYVVHDIIEVKPE